MKGYRDEELSTRWIQFGVFSPIMRLHSSNSAFTGKEPWNYNAVSENIMKRYLKLRHEMIPYLYTMNYHASHDGQPLIRPMYYLEPEQPEAYEVQMSIILERSWLYVRLQSRRIKQLGQRV